MGKRSGTAPLEDVCAAECIRDWGDGWMDGFDGDRDRYGVLGLGIGWWWSSNPHLLHVYLGRMRSVKR